MIAAQLLVALLGLLIVSRGDPRALNAPVGVLALAGLVAVLAVVLVMRPREGATTRHSRFQLLTLGSGAAFLAAATVIAIVPYLQLPADILSFSESEFLGDLIRFRAGAPIYTSVLDNNAYPYMPGTQLLTYGIARLVGWTDSIVTLRVIQYGYVVTAAIVGALVTQELLRQLRAEPDRRWLVPSAAVLLLIAGDPRFNLYTHSLHNDGLALLVALGTFLTLARYLRAPTLAGDVALALWPAAAFSVKQSGLIWVALIALATWLARPSSWRTVLARGVASTAVVAGVVVLSYRFLGGDDFLFWVFRALGAKDVSVLRSAFNLGGAGAYVAILIGVGLWMRTRQVDRTAWILMLVTVLLFATTAYTSGIGFVANHLGPSVMMAVAWGLAGAAVWWRHATSRRDPLVAWAVVAVCLLIPFGMGLVRYPRSYLPADLPRYIAAIEQEFDGLPPSEVLLDNGNWVYLPTGTIMRDRGASVSLHLGVNQSVTDFGRLDGTVGRLRRGAYRRVLVHNVERGQSMYGYGMDRTDSPVLAALDSSYRAVRTIPGVAVVTWWPQTLLGDVTVFERRDGGEP